MPVRVAWFDETKTLVFWPFSGRWTIHEPLAVYE